MPAMWTTGGLSIRELLRRTWFETWEDAVYGQAGRMAFYHFLAIFPSLVIFLALARGVPSIAQGIKQTAAGVVQQMLPDPAAGLIKEMVHEMQARVPAGFALLSSCASALWAAMNATWAIIFGLNVAYEVKEDRSWWKLAATLTGLTVTLTAAGTVALFLLFAATLIDRQFLNGPSLAALRTVQWIVVLLLLMLSFSIVYRFAPNLEDAKWKWSTPGSLCAVVLWVTSTLALRSYVAHITNYQRIYGHLNTVVMLMLWLYFTNAAILIGGEMNSEIEKAAGKRNCSNHSKS